MSSSRSPSVALAFLVACLALPASAEVTTPAAHLGRPVGADFQLADWEEVASYFRRLGEESPRVQVEKVGTTTEGRDFLLAVISSRRNLSELDLIRERAAILADPRGRSEAEVEAAVHDGRIVLFISCAMHATETAAPQFAMELAHRLATSEGEPWATARRRLVVVLAPSLNPDGQDHVVSWYRRTVGTPYETTGLLKLYQYYAGHDNNRDWFMLTQAETRIVTRLLYSVWHPQVYWDVHQQGSQRERFFVPPFRDPLNPNLDPAIIGAIDALGSRALLDLTRDGLTGVSTGVSYDMWWTGGNRNVPVRHNVVGLLTEAASVDLATPVFLRPTELRPPRGLVEYAPSNRFPAPWPGGWWRLRDIIDYELAFARSLFGSLSREPELWRRNALEAARRSIGADGEGAPRAWVLPADNPDPGASRRLVEALLLAGVEVHVTDAPLTVEGRTHPAGSVVIRRGQPYGAHVKDLFEIQDYPDGEPPYDVAGWTLPLLMGVHRIAVMEDIVADLRRVTSAEEAVAAFEGDSRADGRRTLSSRDGDAWTEVFRRLGDGQSLSFEHDGRRAGLFSAGAASRAEAVRLDGIPRVGLYAPWRGSKNEGWMRFVLDTWGVPHVTVRNETLRGGRLDQVVDVLVIPSISASQLDAGRPEGSVPDEYAGGLSPEGAVAVEEFVRSGGTLVTLGSSSQWAIDLLQVPLVDVTQGADQEDVATEERFSCPGSVLRGVPERGVLTAGLPPSVPLFFSRSHAFRPLTSEERATREAAGADVDREVEVLLRYAPTRVLLSGWIRRPESIEGRIAWARAEHGEGRVHLFGFRPQYRGWAQSTFPLVFRAILLDAPGVQPDAADGG